MTVRMPLAAAPALALAALAAALQAEPAPAAAGGAEAAPPCLACHEERFDPAAHPPGPGCTRCHEVAPSHLEDGERAAVRSERDGTGPCLACHARRVAGLARAVAPVRTKAERLGGPGGRAGAPHAAMPMGCLACHRSHAREPGRRLVEPTVEALCFRCHDRKPFAPRGAARLLHPGSRHPVAAAADPAQPGRAFTCVSCHEPHWSTQPALLRYRPLPGVEGKAASCGHCHPTAMGLTPPPAPPPWNEQDGKEDRIR
jgi:predicted CXXCH cytochrome family protein